ncbi:hypothetical protein DFJ58DRAFT_734140 [Suillus subalutaceus]|uniref:uncharacterized protein n=1 Tax=Suillus subalutaceus TaxID=48586 RepID=UPI001B865C68|nr:uncharacterized protein DFJ58DRAFT_734140 [Suillus subalutaceus]KAG1837850.1 hypothetical protein DFJ58DRAFT_734140 [Suillus subalutaceus]
MIPPLPLEIQQKILSLATRSKCAAATALRVSRTTHPWMERLVYKKIVLDGEDETREFLECLRLRPMHIGFAQNSITSLYLRGALNESTLIQILSLCNGLTCLVLFVRTDAFMNDASSLRRALDALQLKSLTLAMAIDFTNSINTFDVFKNLTHLEIVDRLVLKKPHAGLEALHSLTHICLVLAPPSCNPVTVMRLIGNARLRVLAFRVEHSHHEIERFLQKHKILDRRIVLLPSLMVMWDELGRGDMLVWELAEEKVRLPIPQNSGSFIASFGNGSS